MSANAYLKTEVHGASKFDLHLMVVNGAIRYAKFAQDALERRDFEKAHLGLSKSREFVAELIGGLKGDHQPELIRQIKGLFGYAYERLAMADFEHDSARAAEAIAVLESHRATWKELGALLQSATAKAPETASMAPPEESVESGAPKSSAPSTPRGPTPPRSPGAVRIFRDV